MWSKGVSYVLKGMILAGGRGTRLRPITEVINKHLLPVGSYPMIYWPIFKLKEAGITDLLITTGEEGMEDFQKLLGNGENFGVKLSYKIQEDARGIADAVYLAKDFALEDKLIVHLGDNIFKDSLTPYIQSFQSQNGGAKVLLKQVSDPQRYGIASINKDEGTITSIEEKPVDPLSNYCVTGIYMYDNQVFDFIESIVPSQRGEMEITDVNNLYIKQGQLTYDFLDGWWIDAGTHEALFQANSLVYEESWKTEDG
jgi:glucose-1-phosphate thymidylyltransferase